MWWLRDLSRAVAKEYIREKNRKPETIVRSEGQAHAERFQKATGMEFFHVKTMTQAEYEASMPPEQLEFNERYAREQNPLRLSHEQEQLVRMMRNEGERILRRIDALSEKYISCAIGLPEMTEGIELIERNLHDHFFVHSDTFHILPLATIEAVFNEYQQAITHVKRECHIV